MELEMIAQLQYCGMAAPKRYSHYNGADIESL